MAKKKSTQLIPLAGYIQANFIPSSITASQIEAIPPYPDVGVEFKGYAKKLGSGGYTLLKQETYQLVNSFIFTAGAGPITLTAQAREGYDIYISDISMTCFSDISCRFIISEYPSLDSIAGMVVLANNSNSITLQFQSPYKLKSNVIAAYANTAVTGRLLINVTGWYEKVP